MSTKKADLHVHTIVSDGTFSPQEAVSYAKKIGLSALAITDHDCVDGISPAIEFSKDKGVEIIPGIELTAEDASNEIHILGFFIDWNKPWLKEKLKKLCLGRLNRMKEMLGKLNKNGFKITIEELLESSGPSGVVGRLHLAQLMLKKNYVFSLEEAFKRYIGDWAPFYVKKINLSYQDAIETILKLGGIPVLAHPHLLHRDDLIPALVKAGLKGIEAYHTEQPAKVSRRYESLAKEYNLLITGGSDCHGQGKGKILMGGVTVPYELVEKLKEAKNNLDELCEQPR